METGGPGTYGRHVIKRPKPATTLIYVPNRLLHGTVDPLKITMPIFTVASGLNTGNCA